MMLIIWLSRAWLYQAKGIHRHLWLTQIYLARSMHVMLHEWNDKAIAYGEIQGEVRSSVAPQESCHHMQQRERSVRHT